MKRKKLQRILIANRGEIAIRIAKTLRRLGKTSIGIYSLEEEKALHVQSMDESFSLDQEGLGAYLNQEKILELAKRNRVDAIHPGYGFLSENADFVRKIEKAGLQFIGPSAKAMSLLGDKTASKKFAAKRSIPTLEAFLEEKVDEKELKKHLNGASLPVILKPSAGGGGKGMVVLREKSEFEAGISRARAEAKNAFGDERLMVEPFLEEARHVEVQVAGDAFGDALHLFERDCTLQRRHQKIFEESPSPGLDQNTRKKIFNLAVQLTKEAQYENLGTVEFILDGKGQPYFMEMNTRLQVEHPVTEGVTGFDLVEGQIRIAEGDSVSEIFPKPKSDGHCIECRVYAEEPEREFLPSSGKILRLRLPQDFRIDTGIEEGDRITSDFDPMILKVIVQGKNRGDAISKMKLALEETVLLGLHTNKNFLLWLCDEKEVQSGEVETRWISENLERYQSFAQSLFQKEAVLAAIHFEAEERHLRRVSLDEEDWENDPWETIGGLRIGGLL